MKKILLILLAAFTLSSCYTTFYPPEYMDMGNAESVPDSTRQVIINNYYETTEYYQVPHYRRYSLLWDDYYWDPFYYDYGYYNWRPYYFYGSYYYYNPHNHYWYYYDRHGRYDRHDRWDSGNWSGGRNSGGNADKGRIHKPGYNVLMNSPSGVAPFVSVGSDDNHITKPVGKVGVNVNSGVSNNNTYQPKIQSVGKKSINGNTSSPTSIKKTGSSYKPSSTSNSNKKSSSSSSYSKQKQNSSSSSSSSGKSKSSSTSSTSSKNSSNETSSTSSKKSK